MNVMQYVDTFQGKVGQHKCIVIIKAIINKDYARVTAALTITLSTFDR